MADNQVLIKLGTPKLQFYKGKKHADSLENAPGPVVFNWTEYRLDACKRRIFHLKAQRRLTRALGYQVAETTLNALCIVETWCSHRDRARGSEQSIVDWSGFHYSWKKKMDRGIRNCLDVGLLDRVPAGSGFSLGLTDKGRQCLAAYDMFYNKLLAEFGLDGEGAANGGKPIKNGKEKE